jgi:DNA (cytosine-5)-methyltransferase 1
MTKMSEIACVDIFCGAGGLTHGLTLEGLSITAGYDLDPACKHAYERNNAAKFVQKDVGELSAEELTHRFDGAQVRVLAGCAPCQPFSTYSQRYETIGTPRWGLLYQFRKLVHELRPEIVTMENVSSVVRHQVFDDFVKTLKTIGYRVSSEVIDCADHGLPQSRRRTVLMASLMGPIELLAPKTTKRQTVRSAIGELPSLEAGGSDPRDVLHTSSRLSPLNLERIKASEPGGTWRDWPPHLVAECHRKSTGKTYPGVYGRMTWESPSPTLTTQFYGFGNGRYGHPEQDRGISLREGAILQGFPKGYSFVQKGDPIRFKVLGRLIGNAVPVTLGRVIGKSIKAHLGTSIDSETATREINSKPQGNQAEALVA